MGRLEDLRVIDPVLTSIARGYVNAAYVAEALFPIVNVDKEAGKVPQFGKEAFKVYSTERALRAKSNRINPEGITLLDFTMDEHDLEYPVDRREAEESIFAEQEHATNVVVSGIQLRRERIAALLAQTAGSFPSGNRIGLSGSTQFTHADSDPISVIETAKEAIRSKIGIYPNTCVIGALAWKVVKHHADLIERIKYSQKAMLTTELFAELFEIKRVVVGAARYSDDSDVFHDLWGDNIILAYVPETETEKRSKYEPSFGYTFRRTGKPEIDTYDENGGKISLVRDTDIYKVMMVGGDAGYLIENTNV